LYHSEFLINIGINYYCNDSKINTNYKKSIKYINNIIDNEFLDTTLTKNQFNNISSNEIEIDYSKCYKPILKRDDYTF